MTAGDINQVTISAHIDYQPQLRQDEDGQALCEFLLSHVTACPDSGHWELQHYSVAIYGPHARVFVDTYQPGAMLIITGRLDCQDRRLQPVGCGLAVVHDEEAGKALQTQVWRFASSRLFAQCLRAVSGSCGPHAPSAPGRI